MTTAQKIIKYFAIGFATFLIVTICAAIVYGGLGIVTTVDYVIGDRREVSECEATPCLSISVAISNLEIKKGDELAAEAKNDKVEIIRDEGKLVIKEPKADVFNRNDKLITVYIPEDMNFSTVDISGGVGSIRIDELKTESLKMSLGVGETMVGSLDAKSAEINTGIGKLDINLASPEEEYEILVSKGIGDITFNGKSISNDSAKGNGDKKIKISNGIGAINITTK